MGDILKIKHIIKQSFDKSLGIPATVMSLALVFFDHYFTNTFQVSYLVLAAFIVILIVLFSTLIISIDTLSKRVYANSMKSEIINCIVIEDDIIFFAENNPIFLMNTLVTIYMNVPTGNHKYYEKPFYLGELDNIQHDGLMQVRAKSAIYCSSEELDQVRKHDKTILENLFIKPAIHESYLRRFHNEERKHK